MWIVWRLMLLKLFINYPARIACRVVQVWAEVARIDCGRYVVGAGFKA